MGKSFERTVQKANQSNYDNYYPIIPQLVSLAHRSSLDEQGFNKVGVVSIRMPKNGIQLDQHTRWLRVQCFSARIETSGLAMKQHYPRLPSDFVKTVSR